MSSEQEKMSTNANAHGTGEDNATAFVMAKIKEIPQYPQVSSSCDETIMDDCEHAFEMGCECDGFYIYFKCSY